MSRRAGANKAKIAKRVIEVLEFFDDEHPSATVMDIVRRYDRPQSSTSELLSSLVDLGLLYKDPYARSYTLTPRAAMLGNSVQPNMVRDGRITLLLDRLVTQTGLSLGLFGMVNLNAQVFAWRNGCLATPDKGASNLRGGVQERLSDTAVGWMLLSTVQPTRRDGMIRHLNAGAPAERVIAFPEIAALIEACRDNGYVVGPAGFATDAQMCATLLPRTEDERPTAIGFVYRNDGKVDVARAVECLRDSVDRLGEGDRRPLENVKPLFHAA